MVTKLGAETRCYGVSRWNPDPAAPPGISALLAYIEELEADLLSANVKLKTAMFALNFTDEQLEHAKVAALEVYRLVTESNSRKASNAKV